MPFGKVKYTEVISPSEGQAAADAAAGKFNPKAAEEELHAQKEWNNPYEDERRREAELREKAAKARKSSGRKKQMSESRQEHGRGLADFALFFRALTDAFSSLNNDYGNDDGETVDGEVVPEQLAFPAPKKTEKIDPANIVEGKSWDANESLIERIRRQSRRDSPLDRLPKANPELTTRAGTVKKQVGK